ncbi:MAG: coenzyme F420-0:L-glutamate ligase / coenzyme F420:gamma-L-glutamate ligase [Actinomycetota bacterium]|nr:coenzyme F420-0:L-glutamate ligase / coenzyme F420:gamma-L-glutamate ligase [Actinomycetota bacterium]
MSEIRIIPIEGVPDVLAGDDVALLIVDAAGDGTLLDGDVLVVTQKVVSKAEGRILPLDDKSAAIEAESKRVLRVGRTGMAISETHLGFVCANAGVVESIFEGDNIALLPVDPDASARRIRARIKHLATVDVGVVISDTFGRAWRLGQTDVAIGVAGIQPFVDHVGGVDVYGKELVATRIAIADELAGAAEMVMGKAERICAAIVRGAPAVPGPGAAVQIVRPAQDDLFR